MIIPRAGQASTFEANGQALKDPDGNIVGAVISMHDITGRKADEQELKKHRDQLENLVKERTRGLEEKTVELEKTQNAMQYLLEDISEAKKELETKVAEIERMNRIFVDRELRMVELKERIRKLESESERQQ